MQVSHVDTRPVKLHTEVEPNPGTSGASITRPFIHTPPRAEATLQSQAEVAILDIISGYLAAPFCGHLAHKLRGAL